MREEIKMTIDEKTELTSTEGWLKNIQLQGGDPARDARKIYHFPYTKIEEPQGDHVVVTLRPDVETEKLNRQGGIPSVIPPEHSWTLTPDEQRLADENKPKASIRHLTY